MPKLKALVTGHCQSRSHRTWSLSDPVSQSPQACGLMGVSLGGEFWGITVMLWRLLLHLLCQESFCRPLLYDVAKGQPPSIINSFPAPVAAAGSGQPALAGPWRAEPEVLATKAPVTWLCRGTDTVLLQRCGVWLWTLRSTRVGRDWFCLPPGVTWR